MVKLKSKKEITFEEIQEKAPFVPGPTCKYIDHTIKILIEEVKPLIKDKNKELYLYVLDNLKSELEYVREANRGLRAVSNYYKEQCKKHFKY